LVIVDELVDRWSAEPTDSAKVVWFEMGSPSAPFPATTATHGRAPQTVQVTLLRVPLLMHWAWQEHASALLREYLLYSLEHDPHAMDHRARASGALSLLGEHVPKPQPEMAEMRAWLRLPHHTRSGWMKTDFKKIHDSYAARHHVLRQVDVPPLQYLMVDGHGDPNAGGDYADAIAALYPVAYKLKFASKQGLGRDYVVMPLEAQWWASDMDTFTRSRDKSQWDWTAMIMMPDWITPAMFEVAVATVGRRSPPASLDKVRLETLHEGLCVQTLHIGPYDDEAAILDELHNTYIPEAGLRMTGKHHEVYLSDARKVEPSRLRTILRQPVERAR
jgi:hypothetical protein